MSTTRRLAGIAVAVAAVASMAPQAPATATTPASAPKPYVDVMARTTANLTVRTKATSSSSRVAVLPKGSWAQPVCSAKGQSVGGNRTWYWNLRPGSSGWVSAKYVKVSAGSVPACSSFRGFRPMNAVVGTPAQVASRLANTSASFRAEVNAELRTQTSTRTCPRRVEVIGWWSDNQAIGFDGSCGGVVMVWARVGSSWRELGWNGSVLCHDLRRITGADHTIPGNTGVICFVKSGSRWIEQQYTPNA